MLSLTLEKTLIAPLTYSVEAVGILQFWMYIRKYYCKDSTIVKSLVAAVLVCDTVQQTLMYYGIYTFLVSSIADPVILTLLVKLKLKLLADMITLKTFSMAANTLSAAADKINGFDKSIGMSSGPHALAILDMKSRWCSPLIRASIGLPTSVCALPTVAAFPNTLLYVLFFLLLGRLYTNSILVTREYIKSRSSSFRKLVNEKWITNNRCENALAMLLNVGSSTLAAFLAQSVVRIMNTLRQVPLTWWSELITFVNIASIGWVVITFALTVIYTFTNIVNNSAPPLNSNGTRTGPSMLQRRTAPLSQPI
ncbi:hypothetical protein C8J57DRAFT_1507531 [Mycena rebaudengoi]|nr:hypothetical protein C8J57DRAFT_1507531 [Mycena rebaudengoi]